MDPHRIRTRWTLGDLAEAHRVLDFFAERTEERRSALESDLPSAPS